MKDEPAALAQPTEVLRELQRTIAAVMAGPPVLWTLGDVARAAQVSERTVWNWYSSMPGIVMIGKMVRFDRQAVIAWLSSGATSTAR